MALNRLFSAILIFSSLLLTGCFTMLMMQDNKNTQTISIKSGDGEKYDFYIEGKLLCKNTDVCNYIHDADTPCRVSILMKRGDVTYRHMLYGYWGEGDKVYSQNMNYCPGNSLTIEPDSVIKKQEETKRKKAAEDVWVNGPAKQNTKK